MPSPLGGFLKYLNLQRRMNDESQPVELCRAIFEEGTSNIANNALGASRAQNMDQSQVEKQNIHSKPH